MKPGAHIFVIKLLLLHKASPTLVDKAGKSALELAVANGQPQTIKLLKPPGAGSVRRLSAAILGGGKAAATPTAEKTKSDETSTREVKVVVAGGAVPGGGCCLVQ